MDVTHLPCTRRFHAEVLDDGRVLALCGCGWSQPAPSRRQGKERWSQHRWHVTVAAARNAGVYEDRPRKARLCRECHLPHKSATPLCLPCATAKGLVR